jgi:nitrite reductase (cytochrome c-552)
VRLVEVDESTVDAKVWGVNWPREYDSYLRTVEASRTNFGGGDASPAQKSEQFPWLTRIFAGYAFSLDYRDRRGHAYMLLDQEKTRRVTEKPQPGACLHCHASIIPAYGPLM